MDFSENMEKIERYRREFARYNRVRKAIFRAYFRVFHRFEVRGVENIPEGPALIATNHSGGFDLDIVALSDLCHPTRPIHSLIADEWHYLNSAWGRWYVGGGIPLWTRGGIRWEYIDPYLEPGGKHYPGLIAIYPEGHSGLFRERHCLNKFFPGVVRIALRYRVPIVPVPMIGFQRASPILSELEVDHAPNYPITPPLPFPVKLKAEFGKPFQLSDYYGHNLSREQEYWLANEVVRPHVAEILSRHGKVLMKPVDVEMQEPQGIF